jgi:hypothetical protein
MENTQISHADVATRKVGTDYYAHHDHDSAAKLSTTVIHALADVMGSDVTDAGFELYESIDPDALDRIFAGAEEDASNAPSHLAFTVEGHQVTVYSSGEIVITPPTRPRS